MLCSNIQCINSKFNELKIFIEELRETHNFEFSLICLQECQFNENDDVAQFKLDNYILIPQGKPKTPCSTRGGLITYVHEKFKSKTLSKLNTYSKQEGQLIQISPGELQKPLHLCNIYRPPREGNEHYKQFIQEFTPILIKIEKEKTESIITGDLNINLLKINEQELISEFFDTLTANSFYPKITMPTRFSNKQGTLIDNIFWKLTENSLNTTSGILIKKFSDHQPYFTFLHSLVNIEPPSKYIKINTQNDTALENFKQEITRKNIISRLDLNPNANPNKNYKILHTILEHAKETHMPSKTIKFNKKNTKSLNGLLLE